MLSEKLADRLIRDLPTMSADELGLTIDLVNDWLTPAADVPAEYRAATRKVRDAISAELKRRNPEEAQCGT